MKLRFVVLFIVACIQFGHSQDDSDINPLRLTDTTEIKAILKEAATTNNHKQKTKLLENALELARKQNYTNGIHEGLRQINEGYTKGDDALKSLNYAFERLHQVKNIGDMEQYFRMSKLIAQIYLDYGNSQKAVEYFKNAEKYIDFAASNKEKALLYEQMGDAYGGLNQMVDANNYYNKAIDLINNYDAEQAILQKIATQYLQQKKYEQAILTHTYIKEKAQKQHRKKDVAIALNNIGSLYHKQGLFAKAIPFFEDALKEEKSLSHHTLLTLYANLGVAYQNSNNPNKAIEFVNKAIKESDALNKLNEKASLNNLLSNIYFNQKDLFNAQKYNNSALSLSQKSTIENRADANKTAALIYQQLYEYEKAFEYYRKYLDIKDSILVQERVLQQRLQEQVFLLEKQEKELQLSLINKDIQDLTLKQLRLQSEKLELEAAKKEDELKLLKQSQEVNEATLKNKELEALRARQALEIAQQNLAAAAKDKSLADLRQKEQLQLVELARQKAETQQNLQAISLLTKDKELLTINNELLSKDAALKALAIEGQRNFKRTAYGIGALLLIISLLIFRGLQSAKKNNKLLSQKNEEIEASRHETEIERQKAENLLLNILPDETAEELKTFGQAIPRKYDKVSVLFTDFTNFTKISAKMTAEELIAELNECFVAFDEIIEQHQLEKIKTIGDAYMCAGGIPTPNDTNPIDTVKAAIALQKFMQQRNAMKESQGLPYFQMRIGIHTGSVIAGVVGKNKFAYDIWGDTVNLASRMESTSPPNAINISESTYQYVQNHFTCTYRGEIEAKGKGKVNMYLVGNPV